MENLTSCTFLRSSIFKLFDRSSIRLAQNNAVQTSDVCLLAVLIALWDKLKCYVATYQWFTAPS